MFETLNDPVVVPDKEQRATWKKVEEYFRSLSQEHEESRVMNVALEKRIADVLTAIEQNDFIPAAEYLATEIQNIEQNLIPLYGRSEVGQRIAVPAMKQEVENMKKLYDSLLLEEK